MLKRKVIEAEHEDTDVEDVAPTEKADGTQEEDEADLDENAESKKAVGELDDNEEDDGPPETNVTSDDKVAPESPTPIIAFRPLGNYKVTLNRPTIAFRPLGKCKVALNSPVTNMGDEKKKQKGSPAANATVLTTRVVTISS